MKIKYIILFLTCLLLLSSFTTPATACCEPPAPPCHHCEDTVWVWDCDAGQICCNGTCCDSSDCCNDEICCNSGDNCCTDSGAGDAYCCAGGKTCCDKACCDPSTEKCCDDIGGDNDGYCCNTGQECCEGECCDPDQTCCDGECCDPGQTCCDGTCCEPPVITSISGPDTVEICEQADFSSSAIDPDGTSLTYSWSGGEYPATGSSSSFTTKWPCKGDETVSLTITDNDNPDCCGSGECCSDKTDSDSIDVEVTLPSGCSEGTKSANLQAQKTGTPNCSDPADCGSTGPPINLDCDIFARYNNCTWVFQVTAVMDCACGVCSGNFTEVRDGDDVTKDNYCGIVDVFWNGNGCGSVGGTRYSNSTCTQIHEDCHFNIFNDYLDPNSKEWLLAQSSMDDMPINCMIPHTTTCQAALSIRQSAITADVEIAYYMAWTWMDPEEEEAQCVAAARSCFREFAEVICNYAFASGWADCDECP